MQQPLKHIIHKNTFWLSAERCMYWEEEKALIVADLHLEKPVISENPVLLFPRQFTKKTYKDWSASCSIFNRRD